MHRWETVGGWSRAANKAFLGQMVEVEEEGDAAGVELDRCGVLFSKQAFFSAITSIMAIQQAKQGGLHGL